MLTDNEMAAYIVKHNVPKEGEEFISLVRSSEPSRLVGTHAKNNVCTGHPSRKMGFTIQAESRTAEYGFVLQFEYSDDVLEYWDQVPPVTVRRTTKTGRKSRGSYIGDYLILTKDGPKIVEVKPEKVIRKLLVEKPEDWVQAPEGIRYRPAYEAFGKLGLKHEVYSTSMLNPIRTANTKLLLKAKYSEYQEDNRHTCKIKKILGDNAWISIKDLMDKASQRDCTPLLKMIDRGEVHCLIEDEMLSRPASAYVSFSKIALLESAEIRKRISQYITLNDEVDEVSVEFVPSVKQAEYALEILRRLEDGENSRNARRWRKKIAEGEENGMTPFQSVLPKTCFSGNRAEKINEIQKATLIEYILNDHPEKKHQGLKKSHGFYKKKAKKEHPSHGDVSYKTFRKFLKLADQGDIAFKQGGKRKENSVAPPSDIDDRELTATLPFEKATMDHHLAKIKLILMKSHGKVYTARPWLTVLLDIHTKVVLSVWISFKNPTVRSCAIAIRQCARRHGKLPDGIVIDRGPDFKSVYFNSMLADNEVAPILRPSSHPRYGSEAERFFFELKTQWLTLRPGGYSTLAESRAVSRSHSPDSEEIMTIEEFLHETHKFIEWRNATLIGGNHMSPNEIMDIKSEMYPCVGKPIEVDHKFIVSTAVDARKYTVDPVRGIHIDDKRYWNSELKETAWLGKKVEVRIDPEDAFRVYACVNGKWITCRSNGYREYNTEDPIIRKATSIRLLDCRFLREKAKEDAQEILLDIINDCDEKHNKNNKTNESVENNKSTKNQVTPQIFTQIQPNTQAGLPVTTWEEQL